MTFTRTALFLAGLVLSHAAAAVNLDSEKAELLRMHKGDREAHFKTDVDMLQRSAPDEFIAVSRGKINKAKKSDTRAMFTQYFKGAVYSEWDDLEEPIVRISKDGTMAWMITRVKVKRTQNDKEEKFVYAGIMTYEKTDGKWIRVANVSTFEPST